ncbi:MAG: protein kinase, partial [Myxococcota bacterium]|nr:protein kinase [Myxococcota bacterium]
MNRHQIGNQIAQRYQLRSLIGRGGMGAVYQSLDTKTQRLVALKLIRPEFSSDLKTRRRFNKEARAFAYLKHPNIVEVYDFGQDDDGTLFLAIELVDGHSLRAWRRLALPLSSILSITDQLLAALAHAHARGVIHRDLKPENVLLYLPAEATVPTVKLVDFGLASLPSVARGASQQTGTIIGTPSYMAPEQARPSKGVVGPGTDIYAVGVILYELLCDRLPYEGDGGIDLILKHLQQPVPPLVPRPGLEIPELLSQVVQRALAKKPWDRFVNAADFRRALQAVDVVPEPMPRLELPALDTADGGTQHPTPERLQTPTQSTPTSQRSERSLNERVRSSTRWSVLPRDGGPAASVQIPTPPVGTPSINSDAFATGSGPMLGREVELHRVQEICERALNGQGQIVIIEGESGIGKSRFVRSLVHRYTETGLMRAASGLYAATDGNGPNIGIRGALEVAFATSDMDRSAMRIQVRGVLERLGILDEHDKNELIEYLRPSRNLQTKAVAEVSDASAQRQRSMHALLQRVFRLLAQEIPFLVIFEDVHWATDGIELFLESTASSFRVHSTPCLFVCTATPEELASNPGINEGLTHLGRFEGSCVHRLSLSRLSRQDSLALIRSILPLDPKVADGIATKSGGNPFYAVHFLNSLRQDNRLVKAQGSSLWKLREEYQLETALPPSVADILRRRLQRTRAKLGEKAPLFEELLVRVAILGMSISEPLIEAFLRQEGDAQLIAALDEALDAWINAGLLRENNDRQSDLLAFDHVLIRQVILEDVPSRKRRRLHKIAAITKREHFYPYLQAVASDIADHYLAAGEVEASC